jgi:hypothetical protein
MARRCTAQAKNFSSPVRHTGAGWDALAEPLAECSPN